jgi:hypothetical protein
MNLVTILANVIFNGSNILVTDEGRGVQFLDVGVMIKYRKDVE